MTDESRVRHSTPEGAQLVENEEEAARREASNGLRQAELVRQLVLEVVDGRPFKLRASTLLTLNRAAIEGLSAYAGGWRPAGVAIGESKHEPPGAHQVPELAEDLCDYVNENFCEKSGIHLAAAVMWRLNWIHPFTDGNGRTSRAASYLVLCAREATLFPGIDTIPEQIVANRGPYYDALEDADRVFSEEGVITDNTVKAMEELLGSMLARQLRSAYEKATG